MTSPAAPLRVAVRRYPSLLVCAVLCWGCTIPFDVEFTGRALLEPRPEFFAWYWMTEGCSGVTGDARRVRWYTAGAIVTGPERPVGHWSEPHNITLLTGFERNSLVVRHEILHDLLDGDPNHTDPAWDRCRLRGANG